MFDQLSSQGTRQVSHAPMPVGNIGQAVALQLLNSMYNNFESNLIVQRAEPIPIVSTSAPIPIVSTTSPIPTLSTACIPSWRCTVWSVCSPLGKQARTCTDTKNCGTLTGKPAILQSCTPIITRTTITAAPISAIPRVPIARTPITTPAPPPSGGFPTMGGGNALPLEEPAPKPEDDQAAAAEAQKKAKQKWTYIVLTIIVILIIAYFYFKNRNKTK